MTSQKKSTYKAKQRQGIVPSVFTNRRCEHRHTHLERTEGVRYAVCDACGTIRDNELNARLEKRRFRIEEQPLQAAA